MNVIKPRFRLVHHVSAAADVFQQLNTARVWNGQRPTSVTMDAAVAAAVAKDAIVVRRREINVVPFGEVHHAATLELRSCNIQHSSIIHHL